MGMGLFIYRYSRMRHGDYIIMYVCSLARGVGRWAWHVVVALPYGNCRGYGVKVWAIAAVTRGYGCDRRCEGWGRGYLYIGVLG